MIDEVHVNAETGEIEPIPTIVIDNGGPFRSATVELFIVHHPEPRPLRTRVRSPGQNGSRERGVGPKKYERLFREKIDHGLELVKQIDAYRHDYKHIRPHEAMSWNCPADVHEGHPDPTTPNLEIEKPLSTT